MLKTMGGQAHKLHAYGWPDRLCVWMEEGRCYVAYVELKRNTNKYKLTKTQKRVIENCRVKGYNALVWDASKETIVEFKERLVKECTKQK